jgi:hypothetical protein
MVSKTLNMWTGGELPYDVNVQWIGLYADDLP